MKIVYEIDGEDRIRVLNSGWAAFARENQAQELASEGILGRSIWEFIAGLDVRHIYRKLLERVRKDRRAILFSFRCDSPEARRFMRMRLSPLPARGIQLEASLLRLEERPPVVLLDPCVPRSNALLPMCSWCNRVRVSDEHWAETEEAVVRLDLSGSRRVPALTHTICPPCDGEARALA